MRQIKSPFFLKKEVGNHKIKRPINPVKTTGTLEKLTSVKYYYNRNSYVFFQKYFIVRSFRRNKFSLLYAKNGKFVKLHSRKNSFWLHPTK